MSFVKSKLIHEMLAYMHDKMRANGRRAYGMGRRTITISPSMTIEDEQRNRAECAASLYPDLYEGESEYKKFIQNRISFEDINWHEENVYEEALALLSLLVNTVVPTVLLTRRNNAAEYKALAKELIFLKIDNTANSLEAVLLKLQRVSKSEEFKGDGLISKLYLALSRAQMSLYSNCPPEEKDSEAWRTEYFIDSIWLAEGISSVIVQAYEETDSPNNALYIKDAIENVIKKAIDYQDELASPALADVVNLCGFAVDISRTYIEEAEIRLENRLDKCADETEDYLKIERHSGTPGERILRCIKKAPDNETNEIIEMVIEAIDDCLNILTDYY
jgi:hypothetical protein